MTISVQALGLDDLMDVVIITGASRSGSTFLGALMRHAQNASAHHEFIGGRDLFCISAYAPDHPYVRHEVATGIGRMATLAKPGELLIDVNSNLGFATEAVTLAAPGARLFHLVRNGREVIASNWLRKMYTGYAKGVDIRPSDPAELEAWVGYDRFDKLAWQWNHIITALMAKGLPLIHLEKAVADYDYLAQTLLVPGRIDLTRETWNERRATRVNPSRFKLRDFLRGRPTEFAWTPEREARFQALCGQTMRTLGYE